jgi:hypothetical protein
MTGTLLRRGERYFRSSRIEPRIVPPIESGTIIGEVTGNIEEPAIVNTLHLSKKSQHEQIAG